MRTKIEESSKSKGGRYLGTNGRQTPNEWGHQHQDLDTIHSKNGGLVGPGSERERYELQTKETNGEMLGDK